MVPWRCALVPWPRRSRNNHPLANEISPEQAKELFKSAVFSQKNGNYEEAVHQFRQVETSLLKDISESDLLFLTYLHLGTCLRYIGNYDESIEYLKNALKFSISQNTTDAQIIMANCHQRLAASHHSRGDYCDALIHFQRSIEIRRQQCPEVGTEALALCFVGKAATLCEYGNAEEADGLFDLAFAILATCDTEPVELGSAHYHFGILCRQKEDWGEALQRFTSAKTIFQRFRNKHMSLLCQREIAITFIKQGKYNSASNLLDQVLMELKTKGRSTIDLAVTHEARGMVLSAEEDYDNALLHFDAANQILSQKAPHSLDLARLCTATADAHLAKGDPTNALSCYQQAKSIYQYHRSSSITVEEISEKINILVPVEEPKDEIRTGSRARHVPVVTSTPYPCHKGFDDSFIGVPARRCVNAVETQDKEIEIADQDINVACGGSTRSDLGDSRGETEVAEESSSLESLQEVMEMVNAMSTDSSEQATDTLANIDARSAHIVVVNDDGNAVSSILKDYFYIANVNSMSELMRLLEESLVNPEVIVSCMRHHDESTSFSRRVKAEIHLIRNVRRARFVTPIIIYTSSFNLVESFKDEIMRVGGNAVVSDTPSLVDVVIKCISDAEYGGSMSCAVPFKQDGQSVNSSDCVEDGEISTTSSTTNRVEEVPIRPVAGAATHNTCNNSLSIENVETCCTNNNPVHAIEHCTIPFDGPLPDENETQTPSNFVSIENQHDQFQSSSEISSFHTHSANQCYNGPIKRDPPGHFHEHLYNMETENGSNFG